MDKCRPSREHNLVEWARPLLNHNKKVLRILDPKMDGQYSAKTARKVANLAYQCLSQNPKGRPLMNEVVELLETLETNDDSQEEACTSVKKRNSGRTGSHREGSADRSRSTNVRSRSEPPKECDLYDPTSLETEEKSESDRG